MRGAPLSVRQSFGDSLFHQTSQTGPASRLRFAAIAASGLALGALGVLVMAPSLGSANDDAGIRSVQMQDAMARRGSQPVRYQAQQPVQSYATPVARKERGRFEVFQPIVRSFAPQPRPSRVLPAPIQFGYGDPATAGPSDAFRTVDPTPRGFTKPTVNRSERARPYPVSTASLQSNRSVCVRLCDGYHFPVGTMNSGADWASQTSLCQAACPAAAVQLYSLAPGAMDMARATTRDGKSYSALPTAFSYRKGRDEACTCQTGRQASYMSLLRDITLRAGDTVIVGSKAKVFQGASQWPYRPSDFADFRRSRELNKAQRRQIDSITAASLNVELLKPFTVAKAPINEDVAVVRPLRPQRTNVIELSADAPRPALRSSQGFAPMAKSASSIQVVNVRAPGFALR